MEKLVYMIIGGLLAVAAALAVRFAFLSLKNYIQGAVCGEITRLRSDLEDQQLKFFLKLKSESTQDESNFIANKSESVQNESGSDATPEPPFWNNKKKLENLRNQLVAGDFSAYSQETSLQDLTPLDALRKVDAALVELGANEG